MRRLVVLLICACSLPVSDASAWTWPVAGPVLRPFSFDHAHPYAAGQHRGIDVGALSGSPVLAPAQGVVSFAGTVPTGGKTVSIQTPFGYTATLVHLGSIGIGRGAHVDEGSVVGAVGPSGTAEPGEPYVYFGLRTTSDEQGYVDPLTFLPPHAVAAPAAGEPLPVAVAADAPALAGVASPTGEAPSQPAEIVQPQAGPAAETAPAVAIDRGSASSPAAVDTAARATAPNVSVKPESASTTPRHVTEADAASVSAATPAGRPAQSALAHDGALAPQRARPVQSHQASAAPRQQDRSGRSSQLLDSSAATSVEQARKSSSTRSSHEPQAVAVGESGRPVAPRPWAWLSVVLAALALAGCALLVALRRMPGNAARIMVLSRLERLGRSEKAEEEDLGGAGLALCGRQEAPGSRGGIRGARGHLRAVPQVAGQRCSDGERDGRAWHAGDGYGGSRRRLAA